jgi:hypothetical protein
MDSTVYANHLQKQRQKRDYMQNQYS